MSFMLSLASNPYNPFTEYDKWERFDRLEGYDTAGLFARVLSTTTEISDADQEQAEEDACDSIVNNPSFGGLYIKVSAPD